MQGFGCNRYREAGCRLRHRLTGPVTDPLNRRQRSYCMSCIRGKDTKPEILLRKSLWAAGFRYRLKNALPGRPDLVFQSRRVVLFVDGCFWHRCPEHYQAPKNNAEFWRQKIDGNVSRDKEISALLESMGWTVVRIWEHQIRTDLEATLTELIELLDGLQPPDIRATS